MPRQEKIIPRQYWISKQYMSQSIPFKRGDIVDTNGTKLATSERVYNVILDAKVLLSDETKKLKT